jgi:phosphoglycolate phosphatase
LACKHSKTSHVLVIGDSSNDALAACRAGCPIILVPYGYNHGETIQSVESDGIVANLLEESQLVKTINLN